MVSCEEGYIKESQFTPQVKVYFTNFNMYACNHAGIYKDAEVKFVDAFHDINCVVSLKVSLRTGWLVLDWVNWFQNHLKFRINPEQYVYFKTKTCKKVLT